jgi:hypothetical protein
VGGKGKDWVLGIDISTGGVKVMLVAVEADGLPSPPGASHNQDGFFYALLRKS